MVAHVALAALNFLSSSVASCSLVLASRWPLMTLSTLESSNSLSTSLYYHVYLPECPIHSA